jgi:hypothetical protein
MERIAAPDGCSYDNCPGMWKDGPDVVVRGEEVDQTTVGRQGGEAVVRLPAAMVLAAAERLRQG